MVIDGKIKGEYKTHYLHFQSTFCLWTPFIFRSCSSWLPFLRKIFQGKLKLIHFLKQGVNFMRQNFRWKLHLAELLQTLIESSTSYHETDPGTLLKITESIQHSLSRRYFENIYYLLPSLSESCGFDDCTDCDFDKTSCVSFAVGSCVGSMNILTLVVELTQLTAATDQIILYSSLSKYE